MVCCISQIVKPKWHVDSPYHKNYWFILTQTGYPIATAYFGLQCPLRPPLSVVSGCKLACTVYISEDWGTFKYVDSPYRKLLPAHSDSYWLPRCHTAYFDLQCPLPPPLSVLSDCILACVCTFHWFQTNEERLNMFWTA